MKTETDNEVDVDVDEPVDRIHTSDLLDSGDESPAMPLLDDASELDERWREIQTHFVDEPRRAVEDADALVAEVMRRLAETFASERERLESDWHAGDEVSTEDLRLALQHYRSFFQRLLAA